MQLAPAVKKRQDEQEAGHVFTTLSVTLGLSVAVESCRISAVVSGMLRGFLFVFLFYFPSFLSVIFFCLFLGLNNVHRKGHLWSISDKGGWGGGWGWGGVHLCE